MHCALCIVHCKSPLDNRLSLCYTITRKTKQEPTPHLLCTGAVVNTLSPPPATGVVGLLCAGIGFGTRFDFILEVFQY